MVVVIFLHFKRWINSDWLELFMSESHENLESHYRKVAKSSTQNFRSEKILNATPTDHKGGPEALTYSEGLREEKF